jgi:zinc/manganese transport system substrate-binding protein
VLTRRYLLLAVTLFTAVTASPVLAQSKIKVVATFSVLGDLVKNVGGERVEAAVLVGSNGDAHVYSPSPADAKKLHEARLVIVNGLGLEGWLTRLVRASGTKAAPLVASNGVKTRRATDTHGHSGHGHTSIDPHAWHSVGNAKIYVANIRDGLIQADPAGENDYRANAHAYLGKLEALELEVKATIGRIATGQRRIITSHGSFGYFGDAYGMEFISPKGVSTETDASAKDVAKIIAQVRAQKIPAVFLENITDPRLMQQIAKETGARVGGTLYSDALSGPDGPAASYIDMMRNNIRELSKALVS